MSWTVQSNRLAWPLGTVLNVDDLKGCNIQALVWGDHLAPTEPELTPVSAPKQGRTKPVDPAPADESAEEPEEQE